MAIPCSPIPPEPGMTINEIPLTEGQAMTVRVALESFASSLIEDGLGDDAIGKKMVEEYLERIREVRSFIFKQPPPQKGEAK